MSNAQAKQNNHPNQQRIENNVQTEKEHCITRFTIFQCVCVVLLTEDSLCIKWGNDGVEQAAFIGGAG